MGGDGGAWKDVRRPGTSDPDVLPGPRQPTWACRCGRSGLWASRIKCRCGDAAPRSVLIVARTKSGQAAQTRQPHRAAEDGRLREELAKLREENKRLAAAAGTTVVSASPAAEVQKSAPSTAESVADLEEAVAALGRAGLLPGDPTVLAVQARLDAARASKWAAQPLPARQRIAAAQADKARKAVLRSTEAVSKAEKAAEAAQRALVEAKEKVAKDTVEAAAA